MPHTMQIIRITREPGPWRDRFFEHVRSVFPGADFEVWAKAGCWTNRYDVLALVSLQEIIATVGRTRMVLSLADAVSNGGFRTLREGVQLGAVAVKAEYRGEGYGKHLMSLVLSEAARANQPVFLFSNRAARGFYSSLGFSERLGDQVSGKIEIRVEGEAARLLDPHSARDRQRLAYAVAASSSHRGSLAARADGAILLWYLFNTPIRALELTGCESLVFVEDEADGTLSIRDWLGERPPDIRPFLPQLVTRHTHRIAFGFMPPERWMLKGLSLQAEPDSHLFLRGLNLPAGPLCFPQLLRT